MPEHVSAQVSLLKWLTDTGQPHDGLCCQRAGAALRRDRRQGFCTPPLYDAKPGCGSASGLSIISGIYFRHIFQPLFQVFISGNYPSPYFRQLSQPLFQAVIPALISGSYLSPYFRSEVLSSRSQSTLPEIPGILPLDENCHISYCLGIGIVLILLQILLE